MRPPTPAGASGRGPAAPGRGARAVAEPIGERADPDRRSGLQPRAGDADGQRQPATQVHDPLAPTGPPAPPAPTAPPALPALPALPAPTAAGGTTTFGFVASGNGALAPTGTACTSP